LNKLWNQLDQIRRQSTRLFLKVLQPRDDGTECTTEAFFIRESLPHFEECMDKQAARDDNAQREPTK
jgi:hypothetical protein